MYISEFSEGVQASVFSVMFFIHPLGKVGDVSLRLERGIILPRVCITTLNFIQIKAKHFQRKFFLPTSEKLKICRNIHTTYTHTHTKNKNETNASRPVLNNIFRQFSRQRRKYSTVTREN